MNTRIADADAPVRMIEVGWKNHLALVIEEGASRADAEKDERAFYAGAFWLQSILQELVNQALPSETRLKRIASLDIELEEALPLITGDGDRSRIVRS